MRHRLLSYILPMCIDTGLKEQIGLFASCFADAHYKVNLSASTLGELASEAHPLAFTTSLSSSPENHWLGAQGEERQETREDDDKEREM